MQYHLLGQTDLRVSRLCLGCMTFGEPDRGKHAWTLPEDSSRPIIQRALEGGKIRYVSCDKLLGEAIRRIANEESVSKLFD